MARDLARGGAFLGLLALVASASAAPNEGSGASVLGGAHDGTVTARLLADVAEIAPGEPFRLGIEITMADGWHTYWENGGDAGLPTTAEWTLPEGFAASEIRWPVPHRYEEEGDLVTFGYADRVLLLTEITPAASVTAGETVTIASRVDWLQCKDICIPGGADLSLRLPVASEPKAAAAPVVSAFDATAARVAPSAATLPNIGVHAFQSLDAVPVEGTTDVAVVFSGLGDFVTERAEFFPRPSDQLWTRDGSFKSDGENLALVIPVEVDATVEAGSVETLPAVVRIPRADGDPWLLSFEVPVTIAEAGVEGRATNAPVFASATGPFLTDDYVTGTATKATGRLGLVQLLRYLLFALVGGVILNVMPCVLPVISLKVLGFVSKAEEHPAKILRLGLTFAGGVLVSFVVLALAVIALKSAGEHIGWGFQFQNPAFVAGLSAVIFVFALSLLGVFEVGATTALIGLGVAAADRKEYADAFFHGILTTVLATPCTAPMLGAAIAFAFSQPAAIILLIFVTVGIGLALPYVLLSAHPAWLAYVPRPGPWMDTFKQGMGFLLLATLVWLLFVFGAQTGSDGLVWLLAFLLVVGFFCWIHGRFLDLTSTNRRLVTIWAISIVGTVWSYQGFLHDVLFPAEEPPGMEGAAFTSRSEVTKGGIRWEPFSVEYLDESVESGRTVFIDFTADWCWTCKINEKTVLADREVEDAFRENRVMTLKGDWTRKDPEITAILQRHNRAGVPFYAVYPAGRPDDVIVLPEIINKKLVLKSLEEAGPSRSPGV
jgi:thiol:disulfide interchange protein DsbD